MRFASQIKTELDADSYMPFVRHSDQHTIVNRDRSVFQMIQLEGISFRTADISSINTLHDRLGHALRNVADDRLMIYTHVIRSEDNDYLADTFETSLGRWIDQKYKAKLDQRKLFRNDIFVTLHLQPRGMSSAKFNSFFKRTRTSQVGAEAELVNELEEKTTQLFRSLLKYNPKRLSIVENDKGILISEPASVLRRIINGRAEQVPVVMGSLGNAIYTDRVIFGREALEIRHADKSTFGAMFGIKEYPSRTRPNMFDDLLTAPFSFVLTQSFKCVSKQDALKQIGLKEGRMKNAGDPAISQTEKLTAAKDELASGEYFMGEHNLSFLLLADSIAELKKRVSDAKTLLSDSGAVVAREDLGIEPQFWAQLPANHSKRARPALQTSRNFTALAPLHNYPTGRVDGNEWGPAVCKLQTNAGSPFYFNFHVGDLAHTFICGPSGSGKTVLQTFLLSQLEKLNCKRVVFDKDRGVEIFVRASGGTYLDFKSGRSTGCSPFMALELNDGNKGFLVELVKSMLGHENGFSAEDTLRIEAAVSRLASLPVHERTVSSLRDLLGFQGGANDIGNRLERWTKDNRLGWVFDNPEDKISFEDKLVGFDITEFLDVPEIRNPIMMYLIRRVEQLINGQRIAIFIDEFWKALSDPYFTSFIRDKLKVIRKQNGFIVAGTQSPSDVIKSEIARTIIEQCANQVWFSNENASKDELITHFSLSSREYSVVRNELPVGTFLVKRGTNSVVCDLNLSGMKDVLTVLSGRTATNEIMYKLMAETPDPADWLPELLKITTGDANV